MSAPLVNASLVSAPLVNASLMNAPLVSASLMNASLANAPLVNASLVIRGGIPPVFLKPCEAWRSQASRSGAFSRLVKQAVLFYSLMVFQSYGRYLMKSMFLSLMMAAPISFGCSSAGSDLWLKSSAFENGAAIPSNYTCDGPDISPPLSWGSLPGATKSLAILCDDPDAPVGNWVHWVIFNIPPEKTGFSEKVETSPQLPDGTRQGTNDFGKTGYGGPCPPGGTHRYFFTLYALDTKLDLSAGIKKADLIKAMEGHILSKTQLMGKYSRK